MISAADWKSQFPNQLLVAAASPHNNIKHFASMRWLKWWQETWWRENVAQKESNHAHRNATLSKQIKVDKLFSLLSVD